MLRIIASGLLLAFVTALSLPGRALAHGFGERYDLPVPLSLYITGAGATVALSFVVISLFVRRMPTGHGYPRTNLLRWRAFRFLSHPAVLFPFKAASVGLLLLVVVGGVIGSQNPTRNLVPTLVWVIWWVGLAYTSALVGNIWVLLNPWKVVFNWAEGLYQRLSPEGLLSLGLPYPSRLGVWPGFALFGVFAWVEIAFPGSAQPGNLALLALAYSLITWAGMFLFGTSVWLRHGEAFSIVFGFFARFAPTELRVRNAEEVCSACSLDCRDADGACVDCEECFGMADESERELALRPYAVGLLRNERTSASQMAFVTLVLASVTFDGFTETPLWANVLTSSFSWLSSLGRQAFTLMNTLGLVAFAGLFPSIYLAFSALMVASAEAKGRVLEVGQAFVYSLVPIALAYHLAHFFSFLLIQGQLAIPLASDPFGFGWDLFGTMSYTVNIAIVNARIAWFVGVGAIVMGHIIAVYIAHVVALRVFREHRRALRSQRAMLVLMVSYTMVSLWIIAQPITEAAVPG